MWENLFHILSKESREDLVNCKLQYGEGLPVRDRDKVSYRLLQTSADTMEHSGAQKARNAVPNDPGVHSRDWES